MAKRKTAKKIFVLDTSVILHDHNAFRAFSDNDVAIPISVLEELDTFKKGSDIINFEARSFARQLDELSQGHILDDWIDLGDNLGRLKVIMDVSAEPDARDVFGEDKHDHRILNVAIRLKADNKRKSVTLVSKDINLRVKAKSMGVTAADYEKGKVRKENTSYKGRSTIEGLDSQLIERIYSEPDGVPWSDVVDEQPEPNHYFVLKNGSKSALAFYNPATHRIERIEKTTAYGITPRNSEQVFAMHALMNPEVKIVTISGVAGTGKTLLALSSAIEIRREYHQVYLARPIVPLSNKDIGYLPGDIKSKLTPYMEPLFDNLKIIQNQYKETDKRYQAIKRLQEDEKLLITPLAYIRGRSLSNIFFIVDEAQNLTPHEVKTIISRAGENTKIVFTGDVFQIDSPYLDTQSNGLSYLIDRIHSHSLHAHVSLEKGERSELANLANELL